MQQRELEDTVEYLSIEERASKYFGPQARAVEVEIGGVSHPGAIRQSNQDHYLVTRRRRSRSILKSNIDVELLRHVDEDAYSLIVADGMGGPAFGELASFLAVQAGWDLAEREIKWPLKISENEAAEIMDKLELYPLLIQKALVARARQEPSLRGMGTTFTGIYTVGAHAFVTHVGDSRAYLMRQKQLVLLTRDHTLAQQLIETGLFSPDSEEVTQWRHMLTNCLGAHDEDVEVETNRFPLLNNDRLIVCSDGLTGTLCDEEIANILLANHDAQAACEALLRAALEKKASDNVTVIVANYFVPS